MKKKLLVGLATGLLLMTALSYEAAATPMVNAANGHYYDLIDLSTDWDGANTSAMSQNYLGMTGHLVTITDAQENIFLTETFTANNLHLHWTGGFQAIGSSEPDGGWSWVTGETFVFNNWYGSEPNNSGGAEDRIIFDHDVTSNGKGWNDISGVSNGRGYVVEYENAPVPEPATMLLLGTGLAGLIGARRRRLK